METKKTRKSNVKEVKKGGSYKMRPSVKKMAMDYINEDNDVKSFNDFLEVAVIAYIVEQKKKPREDKRQKKMFLEDS